jgi:two-component system repressor protein LuxO
VIPVALPALRERGDDVLAIARDFLRKFSAEENKHFSDFSPEAAQMIMNYEWPGNVRQLQNVVRNVVVLHDGEKVQPGMFPPPLNTVPATIISHKLVSASSVPIANEICTIDTIRPMWLVEKETIETAIAVCDGNIPQAAALLELSPSTIYRKRLAWQSV